MYFLLKMGDFPASYVSLPEGTWVESTTGLLSSLGWMLKFLLKPGWLVIFDEHHCCPLLEFNLFKWKFLRTEQTFFEFIVGFYDHDLTWFMNCKYQSGWTLEEESKTLPSFFLLMKISQVGSFRLLWPYFVGALAEQLKGQIWKSNSKVD